jgi:hypothetical protein
VAATNPPDKLRKRVMAAVAALLGAVPASAEATAGKPANGTDSSAGASAKADRWSWDASYLRYSESDRITVNEPQVGVRRDFGDDRALSILATVDTISGATPLGTLPATANTAANTITSASGRLVSTDAGKIPLSDMTDTRIGLNTTYQRPLSSISRDTLSGNISKEHDFFSLGASYTHDRDYNQKNTTLSLGLSPEFDIVTPNGGLPNDYGVYQQPGEFNATSKNKYLLGGLIGVTQIINPRTLMQFNYSPTYENGYQNDPYKLLSLVNAAGDPVSSIHEKRPGYRMQHSFYWLTRWNMIDQDVFSLGLRYFADSWGIHSQTLDFNYRWQAYPRFFFEPHIRYYHQTAAEFFHVGLLNGAPLPANASADYRLAGIDAVTFGLGLGWTMKDGSLLLVRAEIYTQTGDDRPSEAIGAQRNFDLFPTLHASIIQVAYHFEPSKLFGKGSAR